jgi:hypothetical protein
MTEVKQQMTKLAAAVKRNRMTDQLAQQCANTEIELLSTELNNK